MGGLPMKSIFNSRAFITQLQSHCKSTARGTTLRSVGMTETASWEQTAVANRDLGSA